MQQRGNALAVTANGGHTSIVSKMRVGIGQAVYGLNKIVGALAVVVYTVCYKQDDAAVGGQLVFQSSLGLIGGHKEARVDRVRNGRDALPLHQRALSGLPFEPSAAGNKMNVGIVIQRLFAVPHLAREVFFSTTARQQAAVVAPCAERGALASIMAYTRGRP